MTLIEKAEKKVQIAIDKMIDLQQDLLGDGALSDEVQRLLDRLNELESRISSSMAKGGKLY